MLVTIQALKSYIDNSEEKSEKCLAIHELYLNLKSAPSSQIPFPKGDSFEDYLSLRNYREEIEDARISGSICPSCGSHDIKSYGSNWKRARACWGLASLCIPPPLMPPAGGSQYQESPSPVIVMGGIKLYPIQSNCACSQ